MSTKRWTAAEVKHLRRSILDITQEEMARRLGVTVASITRWERGVTKPTALARQALSRLEAERLRSAPDSDLPIDT